MIVRRDPDGFDDVLPVESDFAIVRIQLFTADDLAQVAEVQSSYVVQPLSSSQETPVPPAPTELDFPTWRHGAEFTGQSLDDIDFVLDFVEPSREYRVVRERFAPSGLGTAGRFDLDAEIREAVEAGMLDAREPDGSLVLLIQRDPPVPGDRDRWLPAPDGPFYLVLRLYGPGEVALSGEWSPPPVQVTRDEGG